jgi:hypothetical protein
MKGVIEIVDLTYFNGRPVVGVGEGEEEGEWSILLDGDGLITNKDASIEMPEAEGLVGMTFLRTIYSELDTRLQFGVQDRISQEVVLNPMLYTISDPVYTSEGVVYPQVPVNPEDEIPPDPSEDRVADGPENP